MALVSEQTNSIKIVNSRTGETLLQLFHYECRKAHTFIQVKVRRLMGGTCSIAVLGFTDGLLSVYNLGSSNVSDLKKILNLYAS